LLSSTPAPAADLDLRRDGPSDTENTSRRKCHATNQHQSTSWTTARRTHALQIAFQISNLQDMDMLSRLLQPTLRRLATENPVVTLTGPRQSGKTTLLRATFPKHAYATLEDPDVRQFATTDPRGFLDQFAGSVVLDEIQRTPDLFSYIQTAVDRDDTPGRFVLSGSQNFLLLRGVAQSLAGRAAICHLLPFSLSELVARKPFKSSQVGRKLPKTRVVANSLIEVMHRGFYPRIHDKGLEPQRWLRDYYQTYVQRDVRDVINVGDLETFHRFVRLCAGRNGQLLNLSSLGNDCGVTHTTAKRWLSVLEASFIVFLLRPHHRNFNIRLTKSPKLYFLDTGLLCYLLQIRDAELLRHHSSRGAVFESFVISELLKSAWHTGDEPHLYFWRDSTGHEVDVIIYEGESQVPVEIKSSQTIASDFFANLHYWRKLAGDADGPAALVYGGNESYRREGVACYSWQVF